MPPLKQPQLLPVPSVRHRIEAFLERIAPLYPDLKAHGPKRHNALKRLQRLCEREVNVLRSQHTRLPSSSTSPATAMPCARYRSRSPGSVGSQTPFTPRFRPGSPAALIFEGQLKTRNAWLRIATLRMRKHNLAMAFWKHNVAETAKL